MNPSAHAMTGTIPHLSLYDPGEEEVQVAFWRINGHRARIMIWTEEEWERLECRPSDAQRFPCGIWCALRLD